MKTTLSAYDKRRVEHRAFCHWHDQKAKFSNMPTWAEYWQVNRKGFEKTGEIFKSLLSEQSFDRYLSDHELNGWTLHNLETMNG